MNSVLPISTTYVKKLNLLSRNLRSPVFLLGAALILILMLFVVIPLVRLLALTIEDQGLTVWRDVLFGRIAANLFWIPLKNTLLVGFIVAIGTVILGGFMAWLVVMTDAPGRGFLGVLAVLPYMVPGFTFALAWATMFRNNRLGGHMGFLQSLGIVVPDWLAWGFVPINIVLIGHYFSLAYTLIAAALASVNSELVESAEIVGPSRTRILREIILPIVVPAMTSAGLLSFATAVSNFAAPALLGLPVRFYTISTRLYGTVKTGQIERGYVIAIALIVIASALLLLNSRLTGGRRSFVTLTGKGGRRRKQNLGIWRWPLFLVGSFIVIATTVIPILTLILSSFTRYTNSLVGGLTTHFWIGRSNPNIAEGQAGVIYNQQILDAAWNTFRLGFYSSIIALILALAIGYVVVRSSSSRIRNSVGLLSYIPFLIPGMAFGALYIAQFGRPFGPIPALYGTFALMVLAGVMHTLPFASQAGKAAVSQVSAELEEAAVVIGAGFLSRILRIYLPLVSRGLFAGAVLVFVKLVRDLSLMIMIVTPTTSLLSVLAFQYASENFTQFANAITVIIALISVSITLLVNKFQGVQSAWLEKG
jgi:iron(III) transport system permease protein